MKPFMVHRSWFIDPSGKNMRTIISSFILYTLFFILLCDVSICNASEQGEYAHVRSLVHINTNVSSGAYPPEYLAEKAAQKGIRVVFFSENLMPRWEYGLLPLENVIKKTIEKEGLLRYGPERYARRIEVFRAQKGITALMMAEVGPFYFWTGDPFKKDLTLNDWDVQLLVTGFSPRDYRGIPTVSDGLFKRYGPRSVFMLWPLALLALGVFLLKRKFSRVYIADPVCWIMIAAGLLFSANNFPFKETIYDQYHGRAGMGPYQAVIDYVNSKGGMAFWSAPEAVTDITAGPVKFKSPSQERHLLDTQGYAGFCCFYEGYTKIGGPGGVWDRVLGEYCSGKRPGPVWAIGEMAYHDSDRKGGKELDEVETVFLSGASDAASILSAMKSGKMYAVRNSKECRLRLEDFTVECPGGGKAMAGEELSAQGPVKVSFAVTWEGLAGGPVTAQVIRSGKVVKEYVLATPGSVEYEDDLYEPGTRTYYRLDVRGRYPAMLFSNPIFVKFTGQKTENREQKPENR